MQHDKSKNKNSELKIILENQENLTSFLTDVMNKFLIKRSLKAFDFLKSKGIAMFSFLSSA